MYVLPVHDNKSSQGDSAQTNEPTNKQTIPPKREDKWPALRYLDDWKTNYWKASLWSFRKRAPATNLGSKYIPPGIAWRVGSIVRKYNARVQQVEKPVKYDVAKRI
jgi:hypothetical protein